MEDSKQTLESFLSRGLRRAVLISLCCAGIAVPAALRAQGLCDIEFQEPGLRGHVEPFLPGCPVPADTPSRIYSAGAGVFGTRFGTAVAMADVNGDGVDEVIIGERDADAGGTNNGRVLVYHQDAKAREMPGIAGDEGSFGQSLALLDANGDGFTDLAVGAPSGGASRRGQVFLFTGSDAGLSLDPVWSEDATVGPSDTRSFGYDIARAGDVNGDGLEDLIVGAPALAAPGRAFVFLGIAGQYLRRQEGWNPVVTSTLDHFGTSVAGAGDLNGDGYDEAVVGAPGAPAGANRGEFHLFFGSEGGLLPLQPGHVYPGPQNGEEFGTTLVGVGDLTGDGSPYVAVGAFAQGARTVLYRGAAGGFTKVREWRGVAASDLAAAGDIDRDGTRDILAGAPRWRAECGTAAAGSAVVLSGDDTSAVFLWGSGSNRDSDRYGVSVAAGDVDGDAVTDLLIGADHEISGDPGMSPGRAFLYQGAPEPVAHRANGVVFIGDVEDDGWSDIAVAHRLGDGPGQVVVRSGKPEVPGEPEPWRFTIESDSDAPGDASRQVFGAFLAASGVTGQLAVVEPATPGNSGRVRVFRASTFEAQLTGEVRGDLFEGAHDVNHGRRIGGAVAFVGDRNGDSVPDLVIDEFACIALYSGADPDQVLGRARRSEEARSPVSAIVEVGDWIVAADADSGAGGRGSVTVYSYSDMPGQEMLEEVRTISLGEPGDEFGRSLAAVADLNGNGIADLLVGAPGATGGGRVYAIDPSHGENGERLIGHETAGNLAGERWGRAIAALPDGRWVVSSRSGGGRLEFVGRGGRTGDFVQGAAGEDLGASIAVPRGVGETFSFAATSPGHTDGQVTGRLSVWRHGPQCTEALISVSVKVILDAGGNRPRSGFYTTDAQIHKAIREEANEVLERNGARWSLYLSEIVDVEGISEFYDLSSRNDVETLEMAARADPGRFEWRDDGINIYVANTLPWGGTCSFPADHEIIVINCQEGIANGGAGWLHEIGHFLGLTHTSREVSDPCDPSLGAVHAPPRGALSCRDMCSSFNKNVMSRKSYAPHEAVLSECQLQEMSFELFGISGPSGDKVLGLRSHVVIENPDIEPQMPPGDLVPFKRGDANHDGKVDLSDAIRILEVLFQDGPFPSCADAADINNDGAIDVSDPIRAIFHLFMGGGMISAPGPDFCSGDGQVGGLSDALIGCVYDADQHCPEPDSFDIER